MQVYVSDGLAVATTVDSFYQRNKFSQKIRLTDVVFVASEEQTNVVGCVRFCVEEGVPLLRTMVVDETRRKQGIGNALLRRFEEYLNFNGIRNTHLVCSGRLNSYYAQIGFEKIDFSSAPAFLQLRMKQYDPDLLKMTCMRRP